MNSGLYFRLMNIPKEILIKYMIDDFEDQIDLKKIESYNWDRTTDKLNRNIESLKLKIDKTLDNGFDKKSKEIFKVRSKLKQKEMLLKWALKKKHESE